MAFQFPPSREMARSSTVDGKRGVPLNCMCSVQWEMPVKPGVSSREPTRYHSQEETSGAVWISFRKT